MERWHVNVSHLTNEDLRFFGYKLLKENEKYAVYEHTDGGHHIVEKAAPYLYVEDINDAISMNSSKIVISKF